MTHFFLLIKKEGKESLHINPKKAILEKFASKNKRPVVKIASFY
jgi:hypothetical protein